MNDLKEICPNAFVEDGLAIRGSHVKSASNTIISWLKDNQIYT